MMHPRPKMFLAPAMFRMDICEVSRSGIGGGETVVERDLGLGSEHERANTPSTGKAGSIKQGRRALSRPLIWRVQRRTGRRAAPVSSRRRLGVSADLKRVSLTHARTVRDAMEEGGDVIFPVRVDRSAASATTENVMAALCLAALICYWS